MKKLGKGGMGVVYLAEQLSLARKVAFKVLKTPAHAADFRREAMVAGAINHPNVVSIFDIGEAEGVTFIIMEYVNGVSLRGLLRESGRVTVPRGMAVARQILSALARAHRDGLLHRDIKPENVLIDIEGQVKVTDFGLAEILNAAQSSLLLSERSSRGPRRRGTPGYVSPEQARGEPCDPRTDIYSAGITLFEIFSGVQPFPGDSTREILARSISDPIPNLSVLNPEVPLRLSGLISRMAAKAPEMRPADGETALRELDTIARGMALGEGGAFASDDWRHVYSQVAARPVSDTGPFTTPRTHASIWPSLVAVTVAALALVAAGYAYWHMKLAPRPSGSGGASPTHAVQPVTPQERRLQRSKKAYARAEQYARNRPTDYAGIIRNFGEVARSAPGTRYAISARARSADVLRDWLQAGRREVQKIGIRVNKLAADDRFGEALAACRLPQAFRDARLAELRREVRKLRTDVESRGRQRLSELTAAFRSSLAADEFDAAQRELSSLKKLGLPESERGVAGLERDLIARRNEREAEWQRKARTDYYSLLEKSNQLAGEGEFTRALEFLERATKAPAYASIRTELNKEREGLLLAKSVREEAVDYLASNPGIQVRVKGIAGKFLRLTDGVVFIETGAGVISDDVRNLGCKEIARLAGAALQDSAGGERHLDVGVFLLYGRRFREAERELKAADAAGMNTTYYDWLLKIASTDGWENARKTVLAERVLAAMRQARKDKDWGGVLKHGYKLRELADVPVFMQNRREIVDAVAEAMQEIRRRQQERAPKPKPRYRSRPRRGRREYVPAPGPEP